MMASGPWDGHDHQMSTDDDFGQFLDMSAGMGDGEAMQFGFNSFDHASQDHSMMNRQREQPDAMITGDPNNNPSAIMSPGDAMMHNHNAAMSSSAAASTQIMATTSGQQGIDPISNIDAQIQYLQQQKFQQQQRQLLEQQNAYFTHSHSVPPTPQSLEMPPGSGHFYSQHEMYDRNYRHQQRMKEQQDMAFTPLVSPAVTPLDPNFSMESAFTMPGAYFSPLTSPALHAQNDSGSGYDLSTNSNNSPVDMDLEPSTAPVANTLGLSKKQQPRKSNAAKPRGKGGVRSSPISKPQRKKAGPSPAIVSQVLSEVDERNAGQVNEASFLPLPAASTDTSEENASVSPENLMDMPPPPVPAWRSTSKSPYIQAKNGPAPTSNPTTIITTTTTTTATTPASTPTSSQAPTARPSNNDILPPPATPASLMRLPSSGPKQLSTTVQHDQTANENIESFALPESVSGSQRFGPIDSKPASKASTPRIDANSAKLASSKPLPSPSLRRPGTASTSQSPQIRPGSTGPTARKPATITPRTGRKQSTGSVHVSPALLPRISPNIKPLLPGGGDSAESDASRLLMSKSNYQNILEGNLVPGVTYPSELSSNLTSKRTSHKLAEQGRRNRINSALQVMASLLPDGGGIGNAGSGECEDSDKKDAAKQAGSSNSSASKASIVEKAIVHMQNLEKENVGLKKELQGLREELEKLMGNT